MDPMALLKWANPRRFEILRFSGSIEENETCCSSHPTDLLRSKRSLEAFLEPNGLTHPGGKWWNMPIVGMTIPKNMGASWCINISFERQYFTVRGASLLQSVPDHNLSNQKKMAKNTSLLPSLASRFHYCHHRNQLNLLNLGAACAKIIGINHPISMVEHHIHSRNQPWQWNGSHF